MDMCVLTQNWSKKCCTDETKRRGSEREIAIQPILYFNFWELKKNEKMVTWNLIAK